MLRGKRLWGAASWDERADTGLAAMFLEPGDIAIVSIANGRHAALQWYSKNGLEGTGINPTVLFTVTVSKAKDPLPIMATRRDSSPLISAKIQLRFHDEGMHINRILVLVCKREDVGTRYPIQV